MGAGRAQSPPSGPVPHARLSTTHDENALRLPGIVLRARPEQAFCRVWRVWAPPVAAPRPAGLERSGSAGSCPEGPWRYFQMRAAHDIGQGGGWDPVARLRAGSSLCQVSVLAALAEPLGMTAQTGLAHANVTGTHRGFRSWRTAQKPGHSEGAPAGRAGSPPGRRRSTAEARFLSADRARRTWPFRRPPQ